MKLEDLKPEASNLADGLVSGKEVRSKVGIILQSNITGVHVLDLIVILDGPPVSAF